MIGNRSNIPTLRVLGGRVQTAATRDGEWRRFLADADGTSECITPEEAAHNAPLACRLRAAILQRTYRNDYHTDIADIPRLAQAVQELKERILFWGEPAFIAVAREWFASGANPDDAELNALDFGTASTLDVAEMYGPGYAELSRTGSVCSQIPASRPILADLLHLLRGDAPHFHTQHTIVALPRNRKTSKDVRGGAAIHRLHVRIIGSSFWGVAPWYVMQGGVIEVLDYRELYRDPEQISALHAAVRELWFDSPDSAAYTGNLIALNFGHYARAAVTPKIAPRNSAEESSAWRVSYLGPPSLRSYCPAIVRPAISGGGPLNTILDEASASAAVAVFVPLEEPERAAVQHSLSRRGFLLTSIIPSKPGPEGRTPFTGVWSKPKPGVPWAEPYYLTSQSAGAGSEILEHLRTVCEGKTIQRV